VRPMIQERIEKYAANEIRFNLLAVCKNQRQHALQMISQNRFNIELLKASLLSHGIEESDDSMQDDEIDDFTPVPMDLTGLNVEQLKQRLADCRSQIHEYKDIVASEDEKAAHHRQENARRRHNFIPFIIGLLKTLASNQKLQPLIDAAVLKAKSKTEQQGKK
jgi:ubiquitin carboxyl-terminal hydrolase L5